MLYRTEVTLENKNEVVYSQKLLWVITFTKFINHKCLQLYGIKVNCAMLMEEVSCQTGRLDKFPQSRCQRFFA